MSDFSWKKHSPVEQLERYEHCAFEPDSSNEIYIFGGASKDSNTNSTLKISPDTGSCETVQCKGEVPTPRTIHSAASLGDSLYIWGGGHKGPNPVPDLQLHVFNGKTETWSQPKVTGKLPSARHGHVMCVVGSQLYIHGGMAGTTFHKDLHAFSLSDMTCGKVKQRGDLPCARAAHAAASFNKSMFTFGGMSQEGALDDLCCFNAATATWTTLKFDSPMPTPRLDHSMFVVELLCRKDPKPDSETQKEKSPPGTPPSTPNLVSGAANIIPVDLWQTSAPVSRNNGDVAKMGERLAQELHLVENVATTSVPALMIFGGMDTSGNVYNDVLVTRLNDLV
uniref:Rab9 effector protein with kelch motifs n=1 Tax=Ciona savignyi TaxID=51511 RepID=H2YM55_CIOSA